MEVCFVKAGQDVAFSGDTRKFFGNISNVWLSINTSAVSALPRRSHHCTTVCVSLQPNTNNVDWQLRVFLVPFAQTTGQETDRRYLKVLNSNHSLRLQVKKRISRTCTAGCTPVQAIIHFAKICVTGSARELSKSRDTKVEAREEVKYMFKHGIQRLHTLIRSKHRQRTLPLW